MAYVQVTDPYADEQLEGLFSAIGGAFKKAGGFVAKKVVPAALPFVPVVGGVAASAYSRIPGIAPQAPAAGSYSEVQFAPPPAPTGSWWERLYRGTGETLSRDPDIRRTAISYTSQLPPALLAAAAAERARREAAARPRTAAAGLLLPAVVIGALVLRSRR